MRAHWAAVVSVVLALGAATARAHEPPKGKALLWPDQASSAFPFVLTNRGILFHEAGEPGQATFSLRCNEAYLSAATYVPFVAFDPARERFLFSSSGGMLTSDDLACSTELRLDIGSMGSLGGVVGSVVHSKARPERILASTAIEYGVSGLWLSEDFGEQWRQLFVSEASQMLGQMLASPSDPDRFYAVGTSVDLETFIFEDIWLRTDNGGLSWESRVLDLQLTPVAVHPKNAAIVFAHDGPTGKQRLLRSVDAGASFEVVFELESVDALTSDELGNTWWLGGRSGLYVSFDRGQSFMQVHPEVVAVDCLDQHGDVLWMCGVKEPGPGQNLVEGVWTLAAGAREFELALAFTQVLENRACEGAAAGVCRVPWLDWQLEILPGDLLDPDEPDAGPVDANPVDAGPVDDDAGVGMGVRRLRADDGCSVSPSRAQGSWFSAAAAFCGLLGLSLRRAQRRRSNAG